MILNCDIGERGVAHPIDDEIMQYINIANIAVGGHAGDQDSVKYYRGLAEKNSVKISVHLSYPDKENFGRTSLDISNEELKESLEKQYELMSDVKTIKLHGALYNDCCANKELASFVCEWFKSKEIKEIITPEKSELASLCEKDMKIIAEVFAERNYQYLTKEKVLRLMPRTNPNASIKDCEAAINHVKTIVKENAVNAFINDSSEQKLISLKSDSFCIHSDSDIALDLIKRLQK